MDATNVTERTRIEDDATNVTERTRIEDDATNVTERTRMEDDATIVTERTRIEGDATVERRSERELVVSRTVNGPARMAFDAWTKPELFERWWAPKSFPISLLSCQMDVRVGGRYRLEFGYEGTTMEFFGRYLEVTPHSRLVWTNDEGESDETITTVTFDEDGGTTLVVVHDLHPSKEALDAAIASGSTSGMPEALAQLDELLVVLAASESLSRGMPS
jgi:uncharacterized protein YndB with AHSA1/START domain